MIWHLGMIEEEMEKETKQQEGRFEYDNVLEITQIETRSKIHV